MDRRDILLRGLNVKALVGLEVGPLDKPLVEKSQGKILYADHCDTESLKSRWASDEKIDTAALHVDIVWRENSLRSALASDDLAEADRLDSVDYMLASHVIEHVPDLVSWLREIKEALHTNGTLRLAVPDRRFTFDYLRRVTDIVDVADAFIRKRRVPSGNRILDFAMNSVEIDCGLAWRGEIDENALQHVYTPEGAFNLARDAEENGTYHDVHCWVFTPWSFAELMREMASNELLGFACDWLLPTKENTNEFYVSMKPVGTSAEAVESWQQAIAGLPEMEN